MSRSSTSDPTVSLIYSTCPDVETALAIGRRIVEEGVAACVNVLPGMISIYRWKGEIEDAREAVLIVKTTRACAAAAEEALARHHPYDEPAILRLTVEGGAPSYLTWIMENSGS